MTAAFAYGLSVHHFISQVGDYVGFAAIVAVAIMVLLLFAHARETADLRRRAEGAEDELSLLHEQVQWLRNAQQSGGVQPPGARQSSAGMPGPSPGGTQAAAQPGAPQPAAVPPPAAARTPSGGQRSVAAAGAAAAGAAGASAIAGSAPTAPVAPPASAGLAAPVLPGAPVGVGAPALSSATKLIPPTDDELRAVAAAAEAREAGGGSPAPSGTVAPAPSGTSAPAQTAVAPPPSTVAAGRNGNPPDRSSVAAPAGPPAGGGGRRSGPPGPVTSPRRNYGSDSGSSGGGRRFGRPMIAVGALLIVAIVVAVVLLVSGSGSSKHPAQAATKHAHTGTGKSAAGKHGKGSAANVNVDPTSVTVSVLNGTMTSNLAADVSSKLTAKGFQAGSTGNAADQAMQSTVVGYVPNAPNAKNDAYAVAHTLGLKETAVKPVSSANQTVACSGETNCPDQVIVTVGADLNSDAT
jgi:hypothetical protein